MTPITPRSLQRLLTKFLFVGITISCLNIPQQAYADVSGVYIGSTPSFVELVQIIKTPDGRIAGRIETTVLDEKGELETSSFTIEGAADGKQIILSAKSMLLSGDTSLTGFIDNDLLNLSWPGGRRTYQRGDSFDYQAAVTGLQARSIQINMTNAKNKVRANFNELLNILSIIDANRPSIRSQLSNFGIRYEKLYARYYNRRQQAAWAWDAGNSTRRAARLEREARQAQKEIWRLDKTVRDLQNALKQKFDASRDLISSIRTYCVEYNAEKNEKLCTEIPSHENHMEQLIDEAQTDFDAMQKAAKTASIEVPFGKKLLKKIFK